MCISISAYVVHKSSYCHVIILKILPVPFYYVSQYLPRRAIVTLLFESPSRIQLSGQVRSCNLVPEEEMPRENP